MFTLADAEVALTYLSTSSKPVTVESLAEVLEVSEDKIQTFLDDVKAVEADGSWTLNIEDVDAYLNEKYPNEYKRPTKITRSEGRKILQLLVDEKKPMNVHDISASLDLDTFAVAIFLNSPRLKNEFSVAYVTPRTYSFDKDIDELLDIVFPDKNKPITKLALVDALWIFELLVDYYGPEIVGETFDNLVEAMSMTDAGKKLREKDIKAFLVDIKATSLESKEDVDRWTVNIEDQDAYLAKNYPGEYKSPAEITRSDAKEILQLLLDKKKPMSAVEIASKLNTKRESKSTNRTHSYTRLSKEAVAIFLASPLLKKEFTIVYGMPRTYSYDKDIEETLDIAFSEKPKKLNSSTILSKPNQNVAMLTLAQAEKAFEWLGSEGITAKNLASKAKVSEKEIKDFLDDIKAKKLENEEEEGEDRWVFNIEDVDTYLAKKYRDEYKRPTEITRSEGKKILQLLLDENKSMSVHDIAESLSLDVYAVAIFLNSSLDMQGEFAISYAMPITYSYSQDIDETMAIAFPEKHKIITHAVEKVAILGIVQSLGPLTTDQILKHLPTLSDSINSVLKHLLSTDLIESTSKGWKLVKPPAKAIAAALETKLPAGDEKKASPKGAVSSANKSHRDAGQKPIKKKPSSGSDTDSPVKKPIKKPIKKKPASGSDTSGSETDEKPVFRGGSSKPPVKKKPAASGSDTDTDSDATPKKKPVKKKPTKKKATASGSDTDTSDSDDGVKSKKSTKKKKKDDYEPSARAKKILKYITSKSPKWVPSTDIADKFTEVTRPTINKDLYGLSSHGYIEYRAEENKTKPRWRVKA